MLQNNRRGSATLLADALLKRVKSRTLLSSSRQEATPHDTCKTNPSGTGSVKGDHLAIPHREYLPEWLPRDAQPIQACQASNTTHADIHTSLTDVMQTAISLLTVDTSPHLP